MIAAVDDRFCASVSAAADAVREFGAAMSTCAAEVSRQFEMFNRMIEGGRRAHAEQVVRRLFQRRLLRRQAIAKARGRNWRTVPPYAWPSPKTLDAVARQLDEVGVSTWIMRAHR